MVGDAVVLRCDRRLTHEVEHAEERGPRRGHRGARLLRRFERLARGGLHDLDDRVAEHTEVEWRARICVALGLGGGGELSAAEGLDEERA